MINSLNFDFGFVTPVSTLMPSFYSGSIKSVVDMPELRVILEVNEVYLV